MKEQSFSVPEGFHQTNMTAHNQDQFVNQDQPNIIQTITPDCGSPHAGSSHHFLGKTPAPFFRCVVLWEEEAEEAG